MKKEKQWNFQPIKLKNNVYLLIIINDTIKTFKTCVKVQILLMFLLFFLIVNFTISKINEFSPKPVDLLIEYWHWKMLKQYFLKKKYEYKSKTTWSIGF